MARKFNLFNFMEKKIEVADISPVTQQLLEQVAIKELALHIGISYIANTLSKCEFVTYEKNVAVRDSRLYYMLNISPNPNQSSSQFINDFVTKYYRDPRGGALIVPHGQYIYCADNYDIDDTNPLKENIFSNVTFNMHQVKKKYKASDVFYFKLDNQNVKALVDSLYMQYGEVIAQALATYKRSNGTKYKMALERYQAGDPQFQKLYDEVLQKQLKTFLNNDNVVYPQYKGIDLQPFSSGNPKDSSDIIAMRKEVFDIVAQAFKIPLTMMYGNITNMKEIVKVYLSLCIDPIADMIGEELTRKYYSYEEWKNGYRVEVDTSCVSHVDILEASSDIYNAIASGAFNIDDIRRRVNQPVLDTDFSKAYWVTKNYTLAENMMNNPEGGENA